MDHLLWARKEGRVGLRTTRIEMVLIFLDISIIAFQFLSKLRETSGRIDIIFEKQLIMKRSALKTFALKFGLYKI